MTARTPALRRRDQLQRRAIETSLGRNPTVLQMRIVTKSLARDGNSDHEIAGLLGLPVDVVRRYIGGRSAA